MKKQVLWVALLLPVAISCNKLHDLYPALLETNFAGTTSGEQVNIGDGKAWSWIQVDNKSQPQAIGITITKSALTSLPDASEMHYNYLLPLPAQKYTTRFDHAELNWNPAGHEPDPIYGIPHFDFHFYFMDLIERMNIPPYPVDPAKFDNYPDAAYLPPTYRNFGGGVPMMGSHWVDITSPELSQTDPQPFTQTFIYGSYDGHVTFMEPMITLDFLMKNASFKRDIPQPAKWEKSGFYPTEMRIKSNANTVTVSLERFIYRKAS